MRFELPLHVKWSNPAGRLSETYGLTRDISRTGMYFTVPVEVNPQQSMELGIHLPEEIMPGTGFEIRYLAKAVRSEKLPGNLNSASTAIGVAAHFLNVPREAGRGGIAV